MKHTILVAEDDPFIQKLFTIILERAGYAIEMSSDGKLVYEKKSHWPSLFILDKQLPENNGLDACRYLKSKDDTKEIPVIIISALPEIGDLAKNAGAEDFLKKPFTSAVLLDKIKKCIDQSEIKSSKKVTAKPL